MAIKLLLIQDVEDLGRSGDVIERVKPGYARNYLLPQGFAVIADANTLRRQSKLKESRLLKAAEDLKEAQEVAKALESISLSISVKVDHEGHMYGSVTQLDIVHMLAEQHKISIEKRNVLLVHPIKTTGIHPISIKLKEGVPAAVTLTVIPEDAEGAKHSKEVSSVA